jgi:hypothetical protein
MSDTRTLDQKFHKSNKKGVFILKTMKPRQITALLLALLLLPLLAACEFSFGTKPATSSPPRTVAVPDTFVEAVATTAQVFDGEATLRAKLEAEVTDPILVFEYGDFDGDGAKEAFAFVGAALSDDDEYEGAVWFVSPNGTEELYKGDYWGTMKCAAFGGKKFAYVEIWFASGSLTKLWGVKDGKPYEAEVGYGGGFRPLDDKNATLVMEAYDMDFTEEMWTGHTYKLYWFYWDGQAGTFKEYGGVAITEAQLRKCEGAAQVLDGIQAEGGTLGEIFYRGNGVINVNYSKAHEDGASYWYATMQLHGTSLSVMEGDIETYIDLGGSYQAAMNPDIAVYPALPAIFS